MSNNTKPTVKGGTGSKTGKGLAHLAKVAAAQAAKINGKTPILVALMLIGAAIWTMLSRDLHGASTAMLYLIANNGKLSGRADGNVYMRNGRVRGFVVPRLVQNGYTTLQRALFAQYSSLWAQLTQSQQDSWINVDNVFKSNRFGQQIPVKGKELFIERNVNLTMVGLPPLGAYVFGSGVNGITGLDSTGATTAGVLTALSIIFSPSPTDSTVEHLVFATAVQGSGINRPKGSAYRLIGVIPNSTASPFNALALYAAKFGNIADTGQKIGIRLTPINNLSGQAGVSIVQVITLA